MKEKVVQIAICIVKTILRLVYTVMKLLPVNKNKIVFCSRQESDVPLDFKLIQATLKHRMPNVKCVNICKRIENGFSDYLNFGWKLICSMYHMATGSVCIIDTYWPAVSILKHKNSLTIIQIWHSIGKMKKSGHQTVGKASGRNSVYASMLNMHENYDYIIAGAEFWNPYYCASFNVKENKLLNFGLPRIDYLLDTETSNRKKFFEEYPQLEGKKIVLYAPTFRRNMKSRWYEIVDNINWNEDYALIIKKHPGGERYTKRMHENVYYIDDWKSIDLISVCEYLITDYSAISLEAAVLKKKMFFWIYDYDEYIEKNGLNINIKTEMAPYAFGNIKDLVACMKNENYSEDFLHSFRKKYLPKHIGDSTANIVELIIESIGKEGIADFYETIRNNGGRQRSQMEESYGDTEAPSRGTR